MFVPHSVNDKKTYCTGKYGQISGTGERNEKLVHLKHLRLNQGEMGCTLNERISKREQHDGKNQWELEDGFLHE